VLESVPEDERENLMKMDENGFKAQGMSWDETNHQQI
jgi:hypothetical protein